MTPDADAIRAALRCDRPGCSCTRPRGLVHCPGHDDSQPSLSVVERDGHVLLKCYAGCPQDRVIDALRARGLWPERDERAGLTLEELTAAKQLPEDFLRGLGVRTIRLNAQRAVAIPYYDADGNEALLRHRLALTGDRFRWKGGARTMLYGLWRLREMRRDGWILLVEGESDCWTAWHWGLPAVGLPGKATWREEFAGHLNGLCVYVWVEPDAQDIVARVAQDLPHVQVIPAPDGIKDLSDAHVRGEDVRTLVARLRAQARPASEIVREQQDTELTILKQAAAVVFETGDPLALLREAIRNLGYGGDLSPAVITYLAMTTRLLRMRPGAMPAHLLIVGSSSAGKSFTVQAALRLLPREAYHEIEAASPRVLIYESGDLRHRVVVFSEIDSLPRGEDNPAASAVRNLLQEHRLRYKVVIRDPKSGNYQVREIVREGPTVLVSAAVRGVSGQLGTRLFTLPVPEDTGRLRTILETQGLLETEDWVERTGPLVAFQAYLQRLAPWDVVVPFAPALARLIGRGTIAPRLLRDFQRLLALVKAATILHHRHRQRDERGRLVATLEDYASVRELVADLYATTVSGASETVRRVVAVVQEARAEGVERVTYSEAARRAGLHHEQARRAAESALRQGWLVNRAADRRGAWADMDLGDPLPDRPGLPTPEEIAGAVESGGNERAGVQFSETLHQDCPGVAHTDRATAQGGVQFCGSGAQADGNTDAAPGQTAQRHGGSSSPDAYTSPNSPAAQLDAGPEGAASFRPDLPAPLPTPAPQGPDFERSVGVARVLFDGKVVYDSLPLPPATCWACGGRRWWRLAHPPGPWRCARCHPPRVRAPLGWHGKRMDSGDGLTASGGKLFNGETIYDDPPAHRAADRTNASHSRAVHVGDPALVSPSQGWADRQVVARGRRSRRVGNVRQRWTNYRCACGWTGPEPKVTHTAVGNLCPCCGASVRRLADGPGPQDA